MMQCNIAVVNRVGSRLAEATEFSVFRVKPGKFPTAPRTRPKYPLSISRLESVHWLGKPGIVRRKPGNKRPSREITGKRRIGRPPVPSILCGRYAPILMRRRRCLGGGFTVGRKPGIDRRDGLVDNGIAHAVLRCDGLHQPVRPLDVGSAVVEGPRR